MKTLTEIEERFYEIYYPLSEQDIIGLEKLDNGPLTNVLSNLHKKCYGVKVYEDPDDFTIDFFYVNNVEKVEGDLIRLKLSDPDYVPLLFYFSQMLVINYKHLDTLDTFNTFQLKLRPFLEKLGFFTVTNLELKQFEGQDATMITSTPRGIKHLTLFDKVDYYRKLFNYSDKTETTNDKEYIYLMVNVKTSLIKIGYSKKPKYRERTLHSQEPEISIIGCWEKPKVTERKLHEMYAHKRIRGEWFRLNLTDLKKIEMFLNEVNHS